MTTVADKHFQEQLELLKQENADLRSKGLSQNKRLNRLLNVVVDEVKLYAEDQISHIKRQTRIGLALSAEKSLNKMLEMIVDEARTISRADAGTLYVVDEERNALRFEILQNDTLNSRIARKDDIGMPPIPLEVDEEPNYHNVSSYVALTGKIINIPDVYETEEFDFTGPRKYDSTTGYRSKSMLVIPMRNHENDIIGVLQLLNALDPETGKVISFSEEHVDLVASLASQAAVVLTNAALVRDLKELFYALLGSIATAIDKKSPYTAGHIQRVVDLTLMIADQINDAEDGPFSGVHFSEDEIEELRLAAWIHDIGKITTPEHIIDKRTKLETIIDRIDLVETRFDLMRQALEKECLQEKIKLLEEGKCDAASARRLEEDLAEALRRLQEDFDLVCECNRPETAMTEEKLERLEEVAQKTIQIDGRSIPCLTPDELHNLSILRGSLTAEERNTIEQHAFMTWEMLKDVPFPKRLSKAHVYASQHHEKLDGLGYPFRIKGEELELQSRIIAAADIFESLTAKDRPYKQPLTLSQTFEIMKNNKSVDPDILQLFLQSRLYDEYARKELSPEQIDNV